MEEIEKKHIVNFDMYKHLRLFFLIASFSDLHILTTFSVFEVSVEEPMRDQLSLVGRSF